MVSGSGVEYVYIFLILIFGRYTLLGGVWTSLADKIKSRAYTLTLL